MREMANWSALPRDGVEAISKWIDNGADYVRFRSVCTTWRSSAPKRPRFPWLLVKYWDDVHRVDMGLKMEMGLYEFPKPYFLKPHQLQDWMNKDYFICGSSRGWICFLNGEPSITLYNPFTESQIKLPPFTHFPNEFGGARYTKVDGGFLANGVTCVFNFLGTYLAKKVMLSSDPALDPNGCVVMGLMYHGERLAFYLPGSDHWTLTSPVTRESFFEDIAFYKGRFYVVSKQRVFVCDPSVSTEVTEILPANPPLHLGQEPLENTHSYLVESSGDLLLVMTLEIRAYRRPSSYMYEVFRVDLSGGHLKLVKLQDLGGRSVFLGAMSMSVSAGEYPGCKGNQIYSITSSASYGPNHSRDPTSFFDASNSTVPSLRLEKEITVIDMENSSTISISTLSDDTHGYWSTAHWLTPSLWNRL